MSRNPTNSIAAALENQNPAPEFFSSPKWSLIICIFLAAATLGVFSPVLDCDFVNYDDLGYITNNPDIQRGFNWPFLKWAFTTGAQSNWHPLTWISHAIDMELYGLKPLGHHITNVLWHAANSILLFLIFKRMTGALWRSAFVAAIFALHPLRVESVAWVSERKDVLSTFFWMLTVWAYVRYVEGKNQHSTFNAQHSTSRGGGKRRCSMLNVECSMFSYLLSLFFFALGLMSKPMLVTLPCVLLLLDWWPLNRIQISEFKFRECGKLLLEKIPFFALAVTSSVVTYLVQDKGGAVSSLSGLPISERVANAFISYCRYISKTVFPIKLSVLYPHPGHWPIWQVTLAVLFLVAVTALVIWLWRARPYLVVGWFWFLGMLVPAIGLVQVGIQSMADRYSYVPGIGVLIMLTWGVGDLLGAWRYGKIILGSLGGLAVATCLALTPIQVGHWKNSETLFLHAVAVTDKNYLAYNNLGYYFSNKGDIARALEFYKKSIEIQPGYEEAHNNLGYALAAQGKYNEAIEEYKKALSIRPKLTEAHNNLGNALSNVGQIEAAISEYVKALELDPNHADTHNNYGIALAMKGQLESAIEHFHQAVLHKANYASAHSNLGNAYASQKKFEEAIGEYNECLRINPEDHQAHNNLANVLAEQGKMDEAVAHYRVAIKLKFENPEAHFNLGFALAKKGRRAEAEAEFAEALRQRPDYTQAREQLNLLRSTPP